jgi:ribosomal 50S subunit-associated protein YjgA (DUF615 family)
MRDPASIPSKTRRKKEATAVQDLGAELTAMRVEQLGKVPLSERTLEAILEFKRTKTHEGRRRQLQRVGRLMRDEDEIAIRIVLADLEVSDPRAIRHLRQVQLWQRRLLDEGTVGLVKLGEAQRGLAPGLHARLHGLVEAHAEGDADAALEIFRLLHGQLKFS